MGWDGMDGWMDGWAGRRGFVQICCSSMVGLVWFDNEGIDREEKRMRRVGGCLLCTVLGRFGFEVE